MKFAYLIEPPFNYRTDCGDVTGHDVEVARYVCAELGETFEPVETEFANLLPGLASDNWQMTTGLFATYERSRVARFTRPVWALPDGLLVKQGNPLALEGYRSIAQHPSAVLAVIRDQFQHQSAVEFGVPKNRLRIFESYRDAAMAVNDGIADAYASVGHAHRGFLEQNPALPLAKTAVPANEKAPAFGAFAVALDAKELLDEINCILNAFLKTKDYRKMASNFGFRQTDISLALRSNCAAC